MIKVGQLRKALGTIWCFTATTQSVVVENEYFIILDVSGNKNYEILTDKGSFEADAQSVSLRSEEVI